MPNDLSIKAAAAVAGASENPAEPRAVLPVPPAHAPPAHPSLPIPNPQLRLDPALGLVVIELRDDHGMVTSIPSERQLQAYKVWDQPKPGAQTAPQADAAHARAAAKD
jgi:hypothetical protein